MKNIKLAFFIVSALSFFAACKSKSDKKNVEEINPKLIIYRASETKINDLVDTRLDLIPDFKNKEMKGLATITLRPHFYPVDSVILDAKYMRIEKVLLIKTSGIGATLTKEALALQYSYDSLKLRIALNKRYTKDETYKVQIAYVAQPEKIVTKGSRAITDRKGLYFINADGKDKDKPIQLWSQGETEAASCWFPTIDAPNQKSTQTISVEIPSKYKSISNGKLSLSVAVNDSVRRDVWVQEKPHAPYLFALVVGDFAEIKDNWNNLAVNYYVEPAYASYAALVFGNTPKMLTYFSDVLGVSYPWDKFHQVVVRDFVSGAMENTGCVVFYDKLQHDSREHLDETNEDVIAHELFHHWFGDLVTCESWSNVPLNESFATYGEYLWNEHQYGRDEADYKLEDFHDNYFAESAYKSEDLIRYHYIEQEDMFDAHSYQKGGSILHMLRKYVGDAAFFAALKKYLVDNSYKTVEASDLRKAFEDVTGEDLNWFFNQWFLDKGHPHLQVTHAYSPAEGYTITVLQKEKRYVLYADIDVVEGKTKTRERIKIDKDTVVIHVKGAKANSYVQFDSENQLLADKEEIKSADLWRKQLEQAKLAAHRLDAFKHLIKTETNQNLQIEFCKAMVNDSFWNNRLSGLGWVNEYGLADAVFPKGALTEAKNEPVSAVREGYVYVFRGEKDEKSLKAMLGDSSYLVLNRALISLGNLNPKQAYAYADQYRNATQRKMQAIVLTSIARFSENNEIDFFMEKIKEGNKDSRDKSAGALSLFILYNQTQHAEEAFTQIEELIKGAKTEESKANALEAIESMHNFFYYQTFYIQMVIGIRKDLKDKYQQKLADSKKYYKRMDDLLKKYTDKK